MKQAKTDVDSTMTGMVEDVEGTVVDVDVMRTKVGADVTKIVMEAAMNKKARRSKNKDVKEVMINKEETVMKKLRIYG